MQVLIFSKANCPPCVKLKSIIPDLQEEFPNVSWKIVDYDQRPDLVKKYHITKTPTTVILGNNSSEAVSMIIGYEPSKISSAVKMLSSKFAINEDF